MIRHRLSFAERSAHYLDVSSTFPVTGREDALALFMPVWAPGSYLVREFARHLEGFEASEASGRSLAVTKTRKNRWRLELAPGVDEVQVRYRLYARDLTVRTNFVDEELALLHGAATFLAPVGREDEECRVIVELPAGWTLECPLPLVDGELRSADFAELIDSPLLCGAGLLTQSFVASGAEHRLIHVGADAYWPASQSALDVARIVATQHAFWGHLPADGREATPLPYDRYIFMNVIADGAGGLEHRASTVLLTSRFKARTRRGYTDWLGLVSHELFHAWNVKRLRPEALGPGPEGAMDLEGEVYTRDLWVAEGITSYYDDLLVHRAGLSTREEYLVALSEHLQRVLTTPGRARQSLSLASWDTWIKFYRPDENSANSSVSYYLKGAVVAWLLDVEIRRRTGGAASLDDALRLAYARFAAERGFSTDELRDLVAEVVGGSLEGFFSLAVDGTDELELDPALGWLGLRLAPPPSAPTEGPRGWLGVTLRREDGRVLVTEVRRGTPAAAAGVSAGDELLALAGYRVPAAAWEERLALHRPGETVELLLARRERLRFLSITFGAEPAPIRLEPDPGASVEQRRHLEEWLGSTLR